MWLAGVAELRYTSKCVFRISKLLFCFVFNFLFGNLSGCAFQTLKCPCLLKTALLQAWIYLPGWALVSYCSSPGHMHISAGVSSAGWVCRRSERGCLCPARPGACVVEGLTGETNTPGFVPHSSATAARPRTAHYFPAPLLSFPSAGPKRGPSLLLGLHTPPQDCHTVVALSTQQIKERKAPRKHCNMS